MAMMMGRWRRAWTAVGLIPALWMGCAPLPAGEAAWSGGRYAGRFDSSPVRLPSAYREAGKEMRGIWVATVNNTDFPTCATWEEFRRHWRQLTAQLAQDKFNAVFFQVRPTNDAFYPSKLNPWSRFLAGAEGRAPEGDFDPLAFMIQEAHRNGLEFHAWLNPYRVIGTTNLSCNAYLNTLAPDNFARKNPNLVLDAVIDGKRRLVLNPGEPQVRGFVAATVMELVRNYPLDGIHFDDYFYPDNTPEEADRATFRKYNAQHMSLGDWRRNNVNLLVQDVHRQIAAWNRQNGRSVRFGISPFGIWRNRKSSPAGSLTGGSESYEAHCADSLRWIQAGWIDYIVPQIYWDFNQDVAAYAALCDWWSKAVRGTGVDLYIGLAPYRLGQRGWDAEELCRQLLYNQKNPEIKGSIFFSRRSLYNPENPIMRRGGIDCLRRLWTRRVPVR